MTDTEIIYPKYDTVNKIIYVNKYESFRVERLIATFHRKYYENFYKGYHGFVEDWDTELEKFNGKEED